MIIVYNLFFKREKGEPGMMGSSGNMSTKVYLSGPWDIQLSSPLISAALAVLWS